MVMKSVSLLYQMGLNLLYMYQDKPALLPWWPEPYSHLCKEEESALTRL